MYNNPVAIATDKGCEIGRRESTENRLERRKKQLEEELQAVNEAIELFKSHPYLSNALDLLGRIGI